MSFAFALIFAASASVDLTDQYSREWQTCVTDTSRLWASKPGEPIHVVDRAFIYCRKKMELFLIAQDSKNKELGLTVAQSDEYNAILAGGLVGIIRRFAMDAVVKSRSK